MACSSSQSWSCLGDIASRVQGNLWPAANSIFSKKLFLNLERIILVRWNDFYWFREFIYKIFGTCEHFRARVVCSYDILLFSGAIQIFTQLCVLDILEAFCTLHEQILSKSRGFNATVRYVMWSIAHDKLRIISRYMTLNNSFRVRQYQNYLPLIWDPPKTWKIVIFLNFSML